MKHTTPNTTTSPETAIDLSTLAAELDTSIQALKKAIHLEPSTGELSSPAAFCEALDITSEAYHNLVYCWGSNAFHNIPEPAAGTAEGVALGTLRGIGDRRFVDRERRASAKPVDDKLQSFAARVEGDMNSLRRVLDVLVLDSDLIGGDPGDPLAAAAGCRVAALALASLERAAADALDPLQGGPREVEYARDADFDRSK